MATREDREWDDHLDRMADDQEARKQEFGEDAVKCPVCGEWHNEDEDCAYTD